METASHISIYLCEEGVHEGMEVLRELGDALAEELRVRPTVTQGPTLSGVKDPVSIAGIVFSGVSAAAALYGAILSTLVWWKSGQPKINVSVRRGDVTWVIDNPTQQQLDMITSQVGEQSGDIAVVVEGRDGKPE